MTTRTAQDYRSITPMGLDRSILPWRLYQKAKKWGIWDPAALDFSQDKEDWKEFTDEEKGYILRLVSMFVAGEESVTLDLIPLADAMAKEGRTEEAMFLTAFLFEEAKHVEFFRTFLNEVVGVDQLHELEGNLGENYRRIFFEELPQAMNRLYTDPSPVAQIEASCTYQMCVEGVLAETGYHAFFSMLEKNKKLPGLLEGVGYTKRDESRHIAYGQYLIQRLISADRSLWKVAQKRIEHLLPIAVGVVHEIFQGQEVGAFGARKEDFIQYATKQFQIRMDNLERALTRSVEEIYHQREEELGVY